MSARVDAVASRVQSAVTTRKVTNSMSGVVKAMDAAMKGMNLEKISGLMDRFEQQFEDLDVQSSYMENTMSSTVTTAVPQNDVESLMMRVADEAGYEIYYLPSNTLLIQLTFSILAWNLIWNFHLVQQHQLVLQHKCPKNKMNFHNVWLV